MNSPNNFQLPENKRNGYYHSEKKWTQSSRTFMFPFRETTKRYWQHSGLISMHCQKISLIDLVVTGIETGHFRKALALKAPTQELYLWIPTGKSYFMGLNPYSITP